MNNTIYWVYGLVLRDDGLIPGYFVFPSLTQKAADKNRSSQKPPSVLRSLWQDGDFVKVAGGVVFFREGVDFLQGDGAVVLVAGAGEFEPLWFCLRL